MKSIARRLYPYLSLLPVLAFLTTCGGSGGGGASSAGPPPDEYNAVLLSTTKPLGAETLAGLAEVAADGTFRFTNPSSEAKAVAPHDVIIGGVSDKTPAGFIRFVTSVGTNTQGDLVLSTIPAPIQTAFQKLHVKFTRSIPDIGAAVTGQPASPLRFSKISGGIWPPAMTVDYFPFNGDKDPLSEDDQVHVTGTLSGGIDYTFGIDVDWGDVANIPAKIAECAQQALTNPFSACDPIPEAIVGFSIAGSLKADLAAKGVSFLPYEKNVPVYGPVPLGVIPIGLLIFIPEFEISSKIEGAASSQFATGLSMEADGGVGVSISSKKLIPTMTPAPYATVTTSAPAVDATLNAYSKVRLGPQISLKLMGFAGPRGGLFGFAELKASQDNIAQGQPCYTLNGGVEGELGFEIGVDFPILGSVTLADWHLTNNLWAQDQQSGACTGGSNVATNPLQNPTFTPWSDAYSNMVTTTGLPFSAPGGRIAGTALEQTIDGNFVVAGSGSRGLLKIDGQGNAVWAKRFTGALLDPNFTELLPDHVTHTQDAATFVSAYPWALLKVDAGGDLVWAKQFAFAPKNDWWRVSDITADGSGGMYLVASYGTGTIPLDVDTLAARLDGAGNILWLRRIGDVNVSEVPRAVIPFHNGIVVAGAKCTLNASGLCGFKTLWAINLDASGTILWSREYPLATSSSVYPLTGHEAVDGDLIIGGTIDAAPQRSFLAKIKPDGTMGFLTAYRKVNPLGLEDFSLTSLVPLPQSGYIATGSYLPYPGTLGNDLWVASLDGIGAVQWAKRMRSPDGSEEMMPAITYTSDGGAFVTGYTQKLAGGGTGFWSLKTFAKDGTITFAPATGITVEDITTSIANDTATFCGATCTGGGTPWSPVVQDFAATLGAVQVTVGDLPVAVTKESP